MSTFQRTSEATSYKADTTGTPAFYYYDMVFKHEMSITGIYVFGDSAIARAAGNLSAT
jgi:hypothetical protein